MISFLHGIIERIIPMPPSDEEARILFRNMQY